MSIRDFKVTVTSLPPSGSIEVARTYKEVTAIKEGVRHGSLLYLLTGIQVKHKFNVIIVDDVDSSIYKNLCQMSDKYDMTPITLDQTQNILFNDTSTKVMLMDSKEDMGLVNLSHSLGLGTFVIDVLNNELRIYFSRETQFYSPIIPLKQCGNPYLRVQQSDRNPHGISMPLINTGMSVSPSNINTRRPTRQEENADEFLSQKQILMEILKILRRNFPEEEVVTGFDIMELHRARFDSLVLNYCTNGSGLDDLFEKDTLNDITNRCDQIRTEIILNKDGLLDKFDGSGFLVELGDLEHRTFDKLGLFYNKDGYSVYATIGKEVLRTALPTHEFIGNAIVSMALLLLDIIDLAHNLTPRESNIGLSDIGLNYTNINKESEEQPHRFKDELNNIDFVESIESFVHNGMTLKGNLTHGEHYALVNTCRTIRESCVVSIGNDMCISKIPIMFGDDFDEVTIIHTDTSTFFTLTLDGKPSKHKDSLTQCSSLANCIIEVGLLISGFNVEEKDIDIDEHINEALENGRYKFRNDASQQEDYELIIELPNKRILEITLSVGENDTVDVGVLGGKINSDIVVWKVIEKFREYHESERSTK